MSGEASLECPTWSSDDYWKGSFTLFFLPCSGCCFVTGWVGARKDLIRSIWAYGFCLPNRVSVSTPLNHVFSHMHIKITAGSKLPRTTNSPHHRVPSHSQQCMILYKIATFPPLYLPPTFGFVWSLRMHCSIVNPFDSYSIQVIFFLYNQISKI